MDAPPAAAPDPAQPPARPRGFDRRAWREPRPSPALIGVLGWVNRAVVLPHLVRLRHFDLPDADLARLRAAIRPGAAAFLGPNHPEFFTDWMVDKEISFRVSPLMAHWASYEIVNVNPAAQWLWLRNNLIANVPGGAGREYSIRWALAGHGVLLHPEGTASWHGERVGPLLPGIVDLAWATCERARTAGSGRPVLVVPVVWRLRFTGDVSPRLHREMGMMERALGLPPGAGLPLGQRFAALQAGLLASRCAALGLPAPPDASGHRYFEAQEAVTAAIVRELEALGRRVARDPARIMHRARRAARPEARRERELYQELWRLTGFPRDLYDAPTLTLEAIAENLKRQRTGLVTAGWRNALHNVVPVPAGPRVAHVRVAEPIAVHEAYVPGGDAPRRAELLEELARRLQGTLDALGAELAPLLVASHRPNPLWSGRTQEDSARV
jgi:hypothetical protein